MAKPPGFRASVSPGGIPELGDINSAIDMHRNIAGRSAQEDMARISGQISRLISRLRDKSPVIVEAALLPIYLKSLYYCPVDTGELRDSAELDVQKYGGDKVRGEIRYGNAFAWYAALVHEITWVYHESPTQAKYLQTAMEEGLPQLRVDVEKLVREVTGLK